MTTTAADRTPLTPRQAAIFAYICEYWLDHQCTPTVREINDRMGFDSDAGAICHLKALVKKGWITRESSLSRGIGIAGLADAVRASAEEFFATLGLQEVAK
jgi:SOS-response transcriptional repressor LexA